MATDRIYRGGSCQIDSDDLNLTGGLSVDGAASITGAATFASTMSFVGLYKVGSVAVSTGTTPTWPAGAVAFYGSQNSQALALPNAAECMGKVVFVTTAGTGTLTLTGYGSQTWNGAGTGTITPAKYALLISDGANFRAVITSL